MGFKLNNLIPTFLYYFYWHKLFFQVVSLSVLLSWLFPLVHKARSSICTLCCRTLDRISQLWMRARPSQTWHFCKGCWNFNKSNFKSSKVSICALSGHNLSHIPFWICDHPGKEPGLLTSRFHACHVPGFNSHRKKVKKLSLLSGCISPQHGRSVWPDPGPHT